VLAIRVEWCHVRARKVRWSEEVMLLWEEMQRVLRYLAWQGAWWRACMALRSDLTGGIAAGVQEYALKQANWHDRLSEFFRTKWDVPVKHRNKSARHLVLFCDFLGPVFIQRESASTSEVLLLALRTLAR
jgi:hypothetical protein